MRIQNIRQSAHNRLWTVMAGTVFAVLLVVFGFCAGNAHADRLYPDVYSTDGSDCYSLIDEDYMTTLTFGPYTEIVASTDSGIDGLYIVWEEVPGPWTLRVGDQEYTFGENGYLHEYLQLPEEAKGAMEVAILTGEETRSIADVYVFSKGQLPANVQTWEPSYEETDVLFISTHADDEVIFFGGMIPGLADRGDIRIQLAYFNEYSSGEGQSDPARKHEILNGLWTMGVSHYPQMGEFYDAYMNNVEEAEATYGHDESLAYIVRTIRRFKPQVLVGQDPFNGEYGHGSHIFVARLIQEAIEITADPDQFPESADQYGTWDVPKTYFHLYPENPIVLNARVPLEKFGGLTALEVAANAYLEHRTQQWTDFIVSDGYDEFGNPTGYEYSCAQYGLARSLVGADTGNDIFENITTHAQQEKIAAEEEAARIAAEEAAAEEARIAAQKAEEERIAAEIAAQKMVTKILIIIVLGLAFLWTLTILILINKQVKYRRRKARMMNAMQEMDMQESSKYQKIDF